MVKVDMSPRVKFSVCERELHRVVGMSEISRYGR